MDLWETDACRCPIWYPPLHSLCIFENYGILPEALSFGFQDHSIAAGNPVLRCDINVLANESLGLSQDYIPSRNTCVECQALYKGSGETGGGGAPVYLRPARMAWTGKAALGLASVCR